MLETQAQNITSAIAFWPKQHKGNPDERMEKWIPLDGILLVKELQRIVAIFVLYHTSHGFGLPSR